MKLQLSFPAAAAALGIAAALATPPSWAAPNLVTNGSMDFGESGPPTGWTFLRPGGEFWVSFGGQPSPDGGSYLGIQDLDTFGPRLNAEGLTQVVGGLDVGAAYTLTFWSLSNHDAFSADARQDWVVSFGGQTATSAQTYVHEGATWVQSTMSFTATSTSQALTFLAEYLPGSYPEMLDLDGVVLTRSAAAVPEPSAGALLLAGGLGALGWAAARRCRSGG